MSLILGRKLRQTGDTIVEVLVCMAIISLALGSAYSIAVRSLIQVREAEERSQATRAASEQVEFLKQLYALDPDRVKAVGAYAGTWKNTFVDAGRQILADSTDKDGFKLVPYPPAAPSCNTSPYGPPVAAVFKDLVIPGQFHVVAGFCLVGGGLAGGSEYDVVTLVVRIY